MNDDRTVVHKNPGLLVTPLDGEGVLTKCFGDLLFNLVNHRIALTGVGARSDNKVITDIGKLSKVKNADIFCLLIKCSLCCTTGNGGSVDTRRRQRGADFFEETFSGSRSCYIKRLVEDGIVDGWDDPRLVSIAALRRRGFTPESIQNFVDLCGISKANSSVDYAMLEYCIREDLKAKRPRMMAVLDPVKVIIDNYPEGQVEYLEVDNNVENPELGKRKVPFTRELYVERDDFMEEPPKKYFRMFPGNEVRFMNAYFVKCNSCVKDENGNITEIHCTYDPASKGGNSPDGRKVKGTIHWVSAEYGKQVTVRLYENIVNEELGVYNEDGSLNLNPNSLTVLDNCVVEPELMSAKAYDSFQFVRNGFFCADCKDSKDGQPVFNRIVSLKSSFKLPTAK